MPDAAIPRPRLLAQLALRFDRRLVTVVAGPGFGKTALLSAAVAANASGSAGRDIWLTCEPADESGEHLVTGLASALGLEPTTDAGALQEAIWACAPEQICVFLDDIHEIPAESTGAAMLERLTVDLPANAHLVMASRDDVPIPTARLAASGQLVRVLEPELLLDPDEIDAFARARDVDAALLASAGGWPALAELTASTGADLVLGYLWEEVLARLGPERASLLARFALVGGGDDEIASALAGRATAVDDLVAGVPLVERSAEGWVALHALWNPALQKFLNPATAVGARRAAAAVHRHRGRLAAAIDLLADADDWTEVLAVMREAGIGPINPAGGSEFGRWYRMLPLHVRHEPEALLALGLELRARDPLAALPSLEAAVAGFREKGDAIAELATISQEGLVRWWKNDFMGLLALSTRIDALAAEGVPAAPAHAAYGRAAVAHLSGQSDRVLAHLDGIDTQIGVDWLPAIGWLRSVAHRRAGDLEPARAALDAIAGGHRGAGSSLHHEIARLRIEWLSGEVDDVCAALPKYVDYFTQAGDRFLQRQLLTELASKHAWLGDIDRARDELAAAGRLVPDMPDPVAHVMGTIAAVAIAIADGDEAGAAARLREEMPLLGRSDTWYWWDRAAVAMIHVLLPDARDGWADEPLGRAHLVALDLAGALEAARAGDSETVGALQWPDAGIVRAHLPARWTVELAARAAAAGNPPPEALFDSVGPQLQSIARSLVAAADDPVMIGAARDVAARGAARPSYRLSIGVLGPLLVNRDGEVVSAPELRRTRVRELLSYLVARRKVRREALAEDLWPDSRDSAHNLRVTLNYLQRALQPDRTDGEAPFFVRAEGGWLTLGGGDQLRVDAWELDALVDEAAEADRANDPGKVIATLQTVLPMWRGEPYADAPYADWLASERTRLRERYVAAAIRAGELALAGGGPAAARDAASSAILAEPTCEAAYRLLMRCAIATGDIAAAHGALEQCRTALAVIGVEPGALTTRVLET